MNLVVAMRSRQALREFWESQSITEWFQKHPWLVSYLRVKFG